MKIKNLKIKGPNLKEDLLPRLIGTVFHVTSLDRYKQIMVDGMIKPNKDGKLGHNYSQNSFGRKRGYICLFDLRNQTEDVISNALDCWYFLNPPKFKDKVAFLFPDNRILERMIPYRHAVKEVDFRELFIPRVECWYDGGIPTENIDYAFIVKVMWSREIKESRKRLAKIYKDILAHE